MCLYEFLKIQNMAVLYKRYESPHFALYMVLSYLPLKERKIWLPLSYIPIVFPIIYIKHVIQKITPLEAKSYLSISFFGQSDKTVYMANVHSSS